MNTLPNAVGLGLRAPHYREVLATLPDVPWWEVHSENFFADGGAALALLERVRAHWPVSLHGVGASLGGIDTLYESHLTRIAQLVERVEPAAVSEHLCWSSFGDRHFNDLLPLPYTHAALDVVASRVARMQDRLQRTILVENISSTLCWAHADLTEWEFLARLTQRTGCHVLLDVNNIYVAARNHGFDPFEFLAGIPRESVGEFHLAGHERCSDGNEEFLIDTHGTRVAPPVWALYEAALTRFGPRPTLIEWDTAIPPLATLLDEATEASQRHDKAISKLYAHPA